MQSFFQGCQLTPRKLPIGAHPCARSARFLLPIVLALLAAMGVNSALPGRVAAESAGRYVKSVAIEGNVQVSVDKIRRVVQVETGDRYEESRVQEAVKRLFETKQFSYVEAYQEDTQFPDSVALFIRVREYPKVEDVRFEGNEHVEKEDLEKAISAKKGTFVRPALVDRDAEAIGDLYREKGYYRVSVADTVTVDPESKTRVLVYRVDEGEKVSVQHVDFIGARILDSDDLRKIMKTKEDRWYRGGDFKPKEFEEDKQRILDFYRSNGFLDAEVGDVQMDFSDRGRHLDLFISVREGMQYRVGDMTWKGNELFADSVISRLVTMKNGEVFDDSEFTRNRDDIIGMYADDGYIYCTVNPLKTVRGNVVDVDFDITEGKPAHVREINIVGNTKTYEEVIRRELVLAPGDVFLRSRLIRSLREVFDLGFFAGPPQVIPGRPDENGDIDITLKVEEKPAGQFRLGAGFSQLNRVSGFIGVQEPNFLGRGLRAGLDWEFSRYRQNVNLSLTDPWFRGTPTEVTVDVYNYLQNQVSQQFYSDRRTGGSLRVGRPFPWFDYTSVFGRYSYERVELSDFSPGYVGSLRTTAWPQRTSSVGFTILRNSTDSPFHPSFGTRTVFNARWSGGVLGGDVNFQRYELDFQWYNPLFWRFVLEVRNEFGALDGHSSPLQVPDYEKFRLGGNRHYGLRGYDFYEVVPRGNPQYIGGRFMQITTFEVSFPLSAPTVYGLFFFDGGNTWNSFQDATLFDLRKGVGIGIRIELPMLGTVGLDYGYGIDKVGGADWEPHITFGNIF